MRFSKLILKILFGNNTFWNKFFFVISLSFQNIFKYVWPKKSSHEEKRGRKNAVDEFLVCFFLPELQVLEFVCDHQTFLSYQT